MITRVVSHSEIDLADWLAEYEQRYAILVALVTHKLYLSHEYTANVWSYVTEHKEDSPARG